MATYHIDKKGRLGRCLAFLRPCPYKNHFSSLEDGEAYLSKLEDNRLRHPLLIDEDILNPEYKMIIPIEHFNKKELCKELYITKDSFVILVDKSEKIDTDRFHSLVKSFISNEDMETADFGRAMEHLSGGSGFYMGDQLDARTPYAQYAYAKGKEFFNKMYMSSALEFYDRLAKSKNNDVLSIATAFNYKITNSSLEDGSKLIFFTREEPIKYDFEKDFTDFVAVHQRKQQQ